MTNLGTLRLMLTRLFLLLWFFSCYALGDNLEGYVYRNVASNYEIQQELSKGITVENAQAVDGFIKGNALNCSDLLDSKTRIYYLLFEISYYTEDSWETADKVNNCVRDNASQIMNYVTLAPAITTMQSDNLLSYKYLFETFYSHEGFNWPNKKGSFRLLENAIMYCSPKVYRYTPKTLPYYNPDILKLRNPKVLEKFVRASCPELLNDFDISHFGLKESI